MNKEYSNIYLAHFTKILSNYSILGTVLMLLILLGTVFFALYYIFAFVASVLLIVCTLGLVFISNPKIFGDIFNASVGMEKLLRYSHSAFPYIFGITMVVSIISLILLCVQKENRSVPRIVFSSCIIAISLIVGLIYLLGGLN